MLRRGPSPRMFKSDFVDFFSRTPWWTIPLFWGPVVIGLFTYGILGQNIPWPRAIGQALLGVVIWTFSEYWLHRTVFHWEPNNKFGKRFHFIIHGCHHTWIDDPYRPSCRPLRGSPSRPCSGSSLMACHSPWTRGSMRAGRGQFSQASSPGTSITTSPTMRRIM